MSNRADDVLSVAGGEVGYSRWTDQEAGTKYGRWYADLTGDSYFAQSGVPFCAMFVSWVFAQAGATCQGIPGAYCPWILNAGRDAGALVSCSDAQPGDVVLFDWDGGVCDHVGIVESNDGRLHTIEGNTSGGKVARRTRAYGYVAGIIRPSYDGSSPAPAPSDGSIDEDGYWGPATTRKAQEHFGTTVDGVVSGQPASNRQYCKAMTGWEWVADSQAGGSDLIRAIQQAINSDTNDAVRTVDVDGFCGPDTICGLEEHEGVGADSVISSPSDTVRSMQRDLNNGTF